MSGPAPGYIIIKCRSGGDSERVSYRNFYGPADKGSRKPAFMYPKRRAALQEDVERIKDAIDEGYVTNERKASARIELKEKQDRLKQIDEATAVAQELFDNHKDVWMKRRENIAEELAARMPTRQDIKDKRVNPYRQLENEKLGNKKLQPLEGIKIEYAVLSKLAGEDGLSLNLQRER